jgi:hypothetical protein
MVVGTGLQWPSTTTTTRRADGASVKSHPRRCVLSRIRAVFHFADTKQPFASVLRASSFPVSDAISENNWNGVKKGSYP